VENVELNEAEAPRSKAVELDVEEEIKDELVENVADDVDDTREAVV